MKSLLFGIGLSKAIQLADNVDIEQKGFRMKLNRVAKQPKPVPTVMMYEVANGNCTVADEKTK